MSSKKRKAKEERVQAVQDITSPSRKKILLSMLFLFAVSLTLNCIGINWGQPSGQLWHSDSIAGTKTVYQMPNLFKAWKHKYPRMHFLVNSAFYKPVIDNWKENPVTSRDRSGRRVSTWASVERISILIIISRVLSATMGALTVLAVFLMVKTLFDDYLAGLLAGLTLAFTQLFVFYSHLGNLDIPTTFWFAWSLYCAVKAVYLGKWRHYILLGLFCALAICTKDATAGYVVGLGLTIVLAIIGKELNRERSFKKAVRSIFTLKVLTAGLTAMFFFALLNDLLTNPQAFIDRMKIYGGEFGIAFYQGEFSGQWPLLQWTYRNFYYALGWPMSLTAIAAIVYCIIRYRWKAAFGLLPIIVFYFMVIVRIRFSYPRFFLPGYVCLAALSGKAFADWLGWKKIPSLVRAIPFVFVYAASVLYCIGIDLEMLTDTRYRAEKWFRDNADKTEHIGVISPITYSPRVYMDGFRCSFRARWDRNTGEDVLRMKPAYPKYLIMSDKWYRGSRFDKKFRKELLGESLGYKKVAVFKNKYLYPRKTIFGFAGWTRPKYNLVSPKVIVLEKQQD